MKPSKDFSTRFAEAKQWRDEIRPDIEDVYRFCAPGRVNDFNDTRRKSREETTVFHSLGEECAQDLAGDLVNYFTPPEARWFSSEIMTPVPEEFVEQALEMANEREDDISSLITASNYYDIAPQITFEAATHGTAAVWVQMAHASQPIFFEAVPPSELLITPGHLGYLDRFRCKTVRASTLPPLLQQWDVTFSEELRQKIAKPDQMAKVVWGFWLDWADPGRPVWRMEITVDGKRVTPETPISLGDMAGACPLLVGRFNPQPGRPWGRGCGIKGLPDMRVLDKIEETVLLGLEDSLKTTLIYSNDGFLDFSEGIEFGRAYPGGPHFQKDQIVQLDKTTNLDVGFFTKGDLERRIRAIYFQDGPRQSGDTPPTATQWQDERRRVQQRLGKPSAPLWTELFGPMLQRVEYLGVQAGLLDPVLMLDGQTITTRPVSPLQKAQNLDDAMIARSNLDLAIQASAGMEGGVASFIDMREFMTAMVRATGDPITKIRKQEAPVAAPAAN
jgi:hypothetical protein